MATNRLNWRKNLEGNICNGNIVGSQRGGEVAIVLTVANIWNGLQLAGAVLNSLDQVEVYGSGLDKPFL